MCVSQLVPSAICVLTLVNPRRRGLTVSTLLWALPTADELVELTSFVPVVSRPMPMTSRMSSSKNVCLAASGWLKRSFQDPVMPFTLSVRQAMPLVQSRTAP